MKKWILFLSSCLFAFQAICQSAKEKAATLAENEFSKSKHEKKEKQGVVKEKIHIISSIPVVADLSFYAGNYVYDDLNYRIEIRIDRDNQAMATLHIPGKPEILLKEVTVEAAWFHGLQVNPDGTVEKWEGAFINKNDNGKIQFGLGIKPEKPIEITPTLHMTRIFFKKVSP
ncbi:MAG TPA: hypothetical protein VM012_05245 [Flavitalea sp.]|nr:hypothetical protein [Flavitalea sp.]